MFDSLGTHTPQPKHNTIPAHHHWLIFVIVMTVLVTNIVIVGLELRFRSRPDTGYAEQRSMTVWLAGDSEREELVPPFVLRPIVTVTASVSGGTTGLR